MPKKPKRMLGRGEFTSPPKKDPKPVNTGKAVKRRKDSPRNFSGKGRGRRG